MGLVQRVGRTMRTSMDELSPSSGKCSWRIWCERALSTSRNLDSANTIRISVLYECVRGADSRQQCSTTTFVKDQSFREIFRKIELFSRTALQESCDHSAIDRNKITCRSVKYAHSWSDVNWPL
jgi:hypothetical protein